MSCVTSFVFVIFKIGYDAVASGLRSGFASDLTGGSAGVLQFYLTRY